MIFLSIIGTRPQYIKVAFLQKEMEKSGIDMHVIDTGQHYDRSLSGIFIEELDIKIDKSLGIRESSYPAQLGKMLLGLDTQKEYLKKGIKSAIVIGDTNSTLAGSLFSKEVGFNLIHIEAGVREGYMKEIPEEMNRIIVDRLSDILITSTPSSYRNLLDEGFEESKIFLTGDLLVDAIEYFKKNKRRISDSEFVNSLAGEDYGILTIHRKENTSNPDILRKILISLAELEYKIIFPIHPRTKKVIEKYNIIIPENIIAIEPLGYLEFLKLLSNSCFILTDSGGIPREAALLGKPSIVLRKTLGWKELIDLGYAILLDPTKHNKYELKERIQKAVLLSTTTKISMNNIYDVFGRPGVAKRIIKVLINEL